MEVFGRFGETRPDNSQIPKHPACNYDEKTLLDVRGI